MRYFVALGNRAQGSLIMVVQVCLWQGADLNFSFGTD